MRRFLLTVLIFISALKLQAQDIHFSQIHASPVRLNPAFTGLFNGDYRFIGNYKSQWKKTSADYNTYSASLDGKVLYLPNKSFISMGLNCYTDKAGDLDFSKSQANAAFSIVKSLSRYQENYISLGVEAGYISQHSDYSKLNVFDTEDRLLNRAGDKVENFDFSGGLSWFYSPFKRLLMYGGVAVYHINEPDMSFEKDAATLKDPLHMKTVLTGGAEISVRSKIMLMPSFISFNQGPHREITVGSYIRHTLNFDDSYRTSKFYYGAWMRWYYSMDFQSGTDAVIFAVRLDHRNMVYSISYDVNVSSLSKVSKAEGGPELSIVYIIDTEKKAKKRDKPIMCPSF